MTTTSVISLVPTESFTQDYKETAKSCLLEQFSQNSDLSQKDLQEQAKDIKTEILKNVKFENEFETYFLERVDTEINCCRVVHKIFLAAQGTGIVFIVVSDLVDNYYEKEALIKALKGIRENLNKTLKSFEDTNILYKYLKIVKDSCEENLKELSLPSYMFSYYCLSCQQNNAYLESPISQGDMTSLLDLGSAKKRELTRSIDLTDESQLHANWSALCQIFAEKDTEEYTKTNQLIAMEAAVQLLWNRAHSFSTLIYKIVRGGLYIENKKNLYFEFLTAITNIEFITSPEISAEALEIFEALIETSRLKDANKKLENRLEMLSYRDSQNREKAEQKYQTAVQLILGYLTVFTVIAAVFNLRWIDLNSWQLGIALSVSLIIFATLTSLAFKYSRARL